MTVERQDTKILFQTMCCKDVKGAGNVARGVVERMDAKVGSDTRLPSGLLSVEFWSSDSVVPYLI